MPTRTEHEAPAPDAAGDLDEPEGAIPEAGLLGRAIDRLGIVFAVAILVSMAILLFEVVVRYGFNAPTIWAHETAIFLTATSFVFGGLYCVARDRHIRVVLLYDMVPPKARRVLDVVISIVTFAASCLLAYAAWEVASRAVFAPGGGIRLETSGSAWDPVYPALLKLFLFIVLVVMAVQFLILAINYARGVRLKKER